MGFDKGIDIGGRDDYFIATAKSAQGAAAYDEDGKEINTGADTVIEFWGKVIDRSTPVRDLNGKWYSVAKRIIQCDAVDVEELNPDFTICLQGSNQKFEIISISEPDFRFTAEIEIQRQ